MSMPKRRSSNCWMIWPHRNPNMSEQTHGEAFNKTFQAFDRANWKGLGTPLRLALSSLLLLLAVLPPAPAAAAPARQDDPAAACQEGLQLVEAGDSAAALPLLAAGVTDAAPASVDDPNLLGQCAWTLGQLLEERADFDAALDAYQTALDVFARQPDDEVAFTVIRHMGDVYVAQGQYDAALEAYQRARDLARTLETKAEAKADEMVVLANIFFIFQRQGRWQETMETTQRMQQVGHAINESTGDALFESIGMIFTMQVLVAQWRCTEAREVGQQALDLAGDDERYNVAGEVFYQNALCAFTQYRFDEALELYQQALAINRARDDHDDEIETLNGIAQTYIMQARFNAALRQAGRPTDGTAATTQASYAKALDALQQALHLARDVDNRSLESAVLGSLGDVYAAQERFDEALDAYQQALQIARELDDRVDEAFRLLDIGEVYRDQQRYDEARKAHEQALQIARAMRFQSLEGVVLHAISENYEAQQRLDEALDFRLQALDVVDARRTTAGSEAARIGSAERDFPFYDNAISLAHQLGQDDLAFAISERGRARAFLDTMATGAIELFDDDANDLLQRERDTALAWQQAQAALTQARAQEAPNLDRLAVLEAQVAQAEAAHIAAQQAIAQRNDQLAALVPMRRQAPLSRAAVQARLPADTTMVTYWFDSAGEQLLAFVLTPNQAQTIALPVEFWEVDQRVNQLRAALTDAPPSQQVVQPEAAVWLYQHLIAPLRAHLTTPRLIIVPHGPLHYLPFAALGDGNGRMLVEEFTLSMLPSASVLPFLDGAAPAPGAMPRVLALGNPDQTLPSAAAEARAVADLFDGQALLGDQATESALRTHAPQADILHLATHGWYDPDAPLASYLTLAPAAPSNTTVADTRSSDASAGARLEADEAYGLDLQQADLVVLSACESNRGDYGNGDDLVGLTRAFFFAGAPTVVASLWRVSDEATAQLMVRFYTHLRAGAGKAAALQQAQQELRQYRDAKGQQPYASPYYWAGFALVGEGDSALVALPWWQRVPWWGGLSVAALGLIVIGASGVWLVRRRRTLAS